MTDIGMRIFVLLEKHGISQSELSRRSGVKKTSLNRYINGDDIPISKAKAIADALGVTLDELLGVNVVLSSAERDLIDCYRSMTPRFRTELLSLARTMADNGMAKNNRVSEEGIA